MKNQTPNFQHWHLQSKENAGLITVWVGHSACIVLTSGSSSPNTYSCTYMYLAKYTTLSRKHSLTHSHPLEENFKKILYSNMAKRMSIGEWLANVDSGLLQYQDLLVNKGFTSVKTLHFIQEGDIPGMSNIISFFLFLNIPFYFTAHVL